MQHFVQYLKTFVKHREYVPGLWDRLCTLSSTWKGALAFWAWPKLAVTDIQKRNAREGWKATRKGSSLAQFSDSAQANRKRDLPQYGAYIVQLQGLPSAACCNKVFPGAAKSLRDYYAATDRGTSCNVHSSSRLPASVIKPLPLTCWYFWLKACTSNLRMTACFSRWAGCSDRDTATSTCAWIWLNDPESKSICHMHFIPVEDVFSITQKSCNRLV